MARARQRPRRRRRSSGRRNRRRRARAIGVAANARGSSSSRGGTRERHGHAGIGRDQQPGVAGVRARVVLAALGRIGESRQSLRRVFLLPDRNLSHAMARAAMNDLPPDREVQK